MGLERRCWGDGDGTVPVGLEEMWKGIHAFDEAGIA